MHLDTRQLCDVIVLDVSGALTMGDGAVTLRQAIRRALDGGVRKFVVNLAHCDFVDSAGMGESVGQSVSVVLALERSCAELRLADFDTLDLSNLNRLRAGVQDLGVPKVYVTAREIAEIDPYVNVICFPDGITPDNLETFLLDGGALDLVVEECDSLDLKIEIRYAARRHHIPVLMDTSDRGLLDIERFDLEPDRPIFHGAVGDLDPARLRGLTTEEKVPYVLKIIGAETISTRLRASLLEVEQSISTWPLRVSGRFFVDVDDLVPGGAGAPMSAPAPAAAPPPVREIGARLTPRPTAANLPIEQVRRFVQSATRAPSGGNSQPWRWLWERRMLSLFLDASRSRSLLDFRSLASIAALGAAAENLVLAARAEGVAVQLTDFPLGDESPLVATFEFAAAESDDEPDQADELAQWIEARVTNRRNAARRPLPEHVFTDLTASIAGLPRPALRWIRSADGLDEVGRLLGAGDRLLLLNEQLHREMMSEIHFDDERDGAGRGIPVSTLELSPGDRAGLEISRSWPALAAVRGWGGGGNLEKMSRKAVAAASAVGMLTMPGAMPADYFRGGRAFERIWLTATKLGIALQPMTALAYLFARLYRGGGAGLDEHTVDGLRQLRPAWTSVFELRGDEAEVMVFRISAAGPPTARADRCPLDEVLEIG